jgi:hypothetical protein
MTSSWTTPTVITQYPEPGAESVHVPWKENEFDSLTSLGIGSVSSNGTLVHLARSPKYDITNSTYYIKATGYNFKLLPTVLSGIEFRFTTKRAGRITDDTIQLCSNDESVGKNYADLDLSPIKVYGGAADMWDSSLTIADIINPLFGIIIRLKSHPQWPHKDTAFLQAMEIRIH